MKLTERF